MDTAKRKSHKFAGQQMSGADMIMHVLADEGVDTLFGYSGGAILPTYDAIFRYNASQPANKQIRLIVPANEQGAGFMAAGYARASGKVGVFMVTSGPGATNCVTPIRDSMADSVPVVLITGQVARASIGMDAFQEAPVYNIMSACAKHVFLVSDEQVIEETLRTAFAIARSGRPGPVVVDIPKDVQNYIGTFKGAGHLRFRGYEQRLGSVEAAHVSPDACKGFFGMLGKCSRPLIFAGGGIILADAARELRRFAETFRIPVVTSLMGIGSIPTTDELAMHMIGMHGTAYGNYVVEDCDFLLAIGARFDDRVAGKVEDFAGKAKYVAHIDIDASEIGKVKRVDWAHRGDAKTALRDLLEYGKGFKKDFGRWVKHAVHLKKRHHLNYQRDGDLIQPQQVIETLNEIAKGDAIVCTGVGQHQMWAAQYFDFVHPRTFITSGSMGTMGFGLPAAIGAQLACPGKTVIDVDGDGSMRMNLGELETATTYDVPVKVVLLNNLGDGMVRQWQHLYFGRRFSGSDKSLRKKDFVKTAEADGFRFAKRLTDKAEIKNTLKAFLAFDGPAFLEVMIDPNAHVYPMIGPGMPYSTMLTGEHIASRPEHAPGPDEEGLDMTKIPDMF